MELYFPVVSKLITGSKPSTVRQKLAIPCPEILPYLTNLFLSEVLSKSIGRICFRVIIGPWRF